MKELFELENVKIDEKALKKFEIYMNLLQKYNKMFNITAITENVDIVKKHFVDSVKGVDNFFSNANVLEVGSGGGFPSIPLKILKEDLNFTLLEATQKKCNFLNIVKEELELNNVTVINGRAEELGKNLEYREKFDIVTARAVASLNVLSEYCLPFIKVGGKFIAYKGFVEEEIENGKNAISLLGGKIKEVQKYSLFDLGERNIVIIDKIKNTPAIYPRGNGKERKKPL